MSDHDKTQKIHTIRRRLTIAEIEARERAALEHFERQAAIAREHLRQLGVAA